MRLSLHHLILVCCSFFLFEKNTYTQSTCGTDHLHEQLKSLDPSAANRLKESEKRIQSTIKSKKNKGPQKNADETYLLPIVVHVIYTNSNAVNNISDAQIESAIQRLNDLYANTDGNSVNTGIQFQLATMDENCQPTNGINRIDGSVLTNYSDHGIDTEAVDTDGIGANMADVLNLSRWDSDRYINLYIVSEIGNNNAGYGTQGFAFFPIYSDPYDAIVVMYNTIGYDYDNCNCYELKSYTDENKTLAHEIGHYLYLYHTFEGDESGTSCPSTADDDGDKVADTPAHIRISSVCPSGNNSCYASSHDYYDIDLVGYNMMGYASQSCRYEFTNGQTERLISTIESTRPDLLNSPGLQTTSIALNAPDCSPQTTDGISGNYGVGPIAVTIGDLEVTSGSAYQDGGYLDQVCFPAYLSINETYDFATTTYGNYKEDLAFYIDWNNDGSFDEEELTYSGTNANTFSSTFTVPTSATDGEWIRARVLTDHKQFNINSACYAPTYGQVEDYPIYIAPLNPSITASTTTLDHFLTLTANPSVVQSFSVSATEVKDNLSINLNNSLFELSTNGIDFSETITISPSDLTIAETTIYVRLQAGQTLGEKAATINISYPEINSIAVQLSGEVGEIDTETGHALRLDGDADYVQTAITNSSSYTFEAWVKYEGGTHIISSNQNEGPCLLINNGKLAAGHQNLWEEVQDDLDFPVDEWTHVAATYDENEQILRLYKNGALVDQGTFNDLTQGTLLIGAYYNGDSFEGKIDEVRIWDRQRSGQEIREYLHLPLEATAEGLVAYYQFNDDGEIARDFINGYAGTLNNQAAFESSTINFGPSGTAQSINDISFPTAIDMASANLHMQIGEVESNLHLSVSYQTYDPNTLSGTSGRVFHKNPRWTVSHSEDIAFQADISFYFPDSTFSDLTATNYSLYRRSIGGDGNWTHYISGASLLTSSSITFSNVANTGQFMVVQDKVSPDTTRGTALLLDGSDDFINTPFSTISGGDSRTFEAWVKPNGSGSIFGYGINSTYKKWIIRVDGNGRLRTEINGAYIVGTDILTDGEWHHIAVVLDNTNGATLDNTKLYVDGRLQAIYASNKTTETINTDASAGLTIGTDVQNRYLAGEIDEVRIWNIAKSGQDIRENRHLLLGSNEIGLVAYYQFNEEDTTAVSRYGDSDGSFEGNLSLTESSINAGSDGISQTIEDIEMDGLQSFGEAFLSIDFIEKTGTEDFVVTYQAYAPNTTQTGTDSIYLIAPPVWTINHSSAGGSFIGHIRFQFPANTLRETVASHYALYYRTENAAGDWTLLKPTADSIYRDELTFYNIQETGQFMIAQTTVSGRGKTLVLDGEGDQLELPVKINPADNAFTVEFWSKIDQLSTGCQVIFDGTDSLENAFFMTVWNEWPNIRCGNQWIPIEAGTQLTYGEWHHIAITWDGLSCVFYINGIPVGGGAMDMAHFAETFLNFGAFDGSDLHFNGALEELRIWTDARTQLDILKNMHFIDLATADNPLSYYQFNGNTNTSTNQSEASEATIIGDPSCEFSGVNIGASGVGVLLDMPVLHEAYDLAELESQVTFSVLADTNSFYLVQQAYRPNTIDGTSGSEIYEDQTWTLHNLTNQDFSCTMLFQLSAGAFSEFDVSNYRLYRRSITSEGDWVLYKETASAITTASISFEGISDAGQYLIVRE